MSAHSDCTDLVLSVGFCGEVRLGSLVGLARARQSPLVPIGRVDSAVLPFLTIQAAFRSDESESVFWTGAIGMERLVDSSFCPCRPMKKLTYISPPENSSAAAQPIRAIWSSEALLNNSMSVSFRGKSARLVHHWTKSEDLFGCGRPATGLAEKCRVVWWVALLSGQSWTSQRGRAATLTELVSDRSPAPLQLSRADRQPESTRPLPAPLVPVRGALADFADNVGSEELDWLLARHSVSCISLVWKDLRRVRLFL